VTQPVHTTATDEELEAAIEHANIPTLLMVVAHLTGDHSWLEKPYRPTRTIALDDNDTGGLPPERQGTIPIPDPPSDRKLVEMLTVANGETVPREYGAMMAEEAQFHPRDVTWSKAPVQGAVDDMHVVVIGAGISGICTAIKLSQLGIPYTVLEKNDRIGGTWLENDYPGAGVDTPSHLYSYSFDPSPSWSRYYAKQPEILTYLQGVVQRHGIESDIRFGVEVIRATYDSESTQWTLEVREPDGSTNIRTATALISSVGQLNRPQFPEIDGLDTFEGPVFHSAQWRHDVDLTGKRVAVIGTGASAMQVVPAIAGVPEELLVFQRSPQWAAPNGNYLRNVEGGTQLLMEQVPYYATWYRIRLLWMFNDKLYPSLQIDPNWPHLDRSVNATNDKHRVFFTEHIRESLADRMDLWDKVLPTYPPYGKRILMDNGWYDAITRDDVELITEKVVGVTTDAIITSDGKRHEADVIVLATGFQSKRMLWPMDIHGIDGQSIRELWGDDDARAYLGMTVPGFPNLFITYGPNTNLGHGGSVIFHAECQVNYISRLLVEMVERGIRSLECRKDVFDEYNARVDAAHSRMIWSHRGMDTWYRNARGRVVTNTPWRLLDYWRMTRRPSLDDFEVTYDDGE
jgi:4-hydroxyacetophenone monooxygenase